MILNKLKNFWLYGILFVLIIFTFFFIFSFNFRNYLSCINIDPNFLVAFVTVITLMVSMIENRKERKYNYNLNLENSVKSKVELVIGKLFAIMNDSENYLKTIKDINYSIGTSRFFSDANNILSLEDIKKDRELIGAYIVMYFSSYIQEDWNLMNEKINSIGTKCFLVLKNYNCYYNSIGTKDFQNDVLGKIEEYIKESEILNREISELTEKMKNTLLQIVVENQNNLKNKYIN